MRKKTKELFESKAKPKLVGIYWDHPEPAKEFVQIAKRDGVIRDPQIVHRRKEYDRSKRKNKFIVKQLSEI